MLKPCLIKYLISDFISALFSWTLFYYLFISYSAENKILQLSTNLAEPKILNVLIAYPFFWILLYFMWGFYRDIYHRSRLKELGASLSVTLTGAVIIFMCLISIDIVTGISRSFLSYFIALFYIHLLVSYFPRLLITSTTIYNIRKGKIGFNTIIIGSDKKAVNVYNEINDQTRSTGNKFIGFININGNGPYPLARYIDHLGGLENISEIISKHQIKEVILAIESTEHNKIEGIISRLDNPSLVIKAIPGMYDILTGRVKIYNIIETPLIQISHKLMPAWQLYLKQTIDIVFSVIALALSLPISIIIMLWIKLDSTGPVIHSHERIGKNGKTFRIYKFRTMINNAEKNGPELSSGSDNRITKPGRFLRRMRLDEIPNFVNVLKGDMSLVGPRPERRHYINQIVKKAPHYNHLLKIKPGITSWGQVKYGYAENVGQMIQRLKYDIIYLENMSVLVDFQILILTILTIFKRKGV